MRRSPAGTHAIKDKAVGRQRGEWWLGEEGKKPDEQLDTTREHAFIVPSERSPLDTGTLQIMQSVRACVDLRIRQKKTHKAEFL